jgi:hypothetical protein
LAKPIWDADPSTIDLAGNKALFIFYFYLIVIFLFFLHFQSGQLGAPFGHGPVLGPANMLTFRSPGLLLSSVLNYKVG